MSDSRLSRACDAVLEAGWLLAVSVTPLFFNLYSRRGFEADKLALLRALIAVMAAAWLVGWLDRRGDRSGAEQPAARSIITRAAVIFAALTIVTALLSIAPRVAWLGSYTRAQGAHTLLSLATLGLLVADRLRTRAQWARLLDTLVLVSVPVAIYALLQAADLDPVWGQRGAGGRASSTQGNPIYLAAYVMMMFCLTLGLAVAAFRRRREAGNLGRSLLYGVALLLQAAALFSANSRGPFLGWLAGLGMLILLAAVLARRRTLIIGALALGAMLIAVLVTVNVPNSPLAGLRDALGLSRLLALTANPGDSADVRILIWEGSAAIVQPHAPVALPAGATDSLNALRPFIGYGPDSLYLVFQQFFPPQLTSRGGYPADTLVGRSHNETWDALTTGGLTGLLAYQLIFLSTWLGGLSALRLMNTRRERSAVIGLWLGGGALGTGGALAANALPYAGLLLPIGTLLGMVIYLVIYALRSSHAPIEPAAPQRDGWLTVALLAALTAHYVEIQFGIAVAATRLLFWLFAALIVVQESRRLTAEDEPRAASWIGQTATAALINVGLTMTLMPAFVVNYDHLSNGWEIVWRALTFDSVHNVQSGAVALLLLTTWLMAGLWLMSDLPRARRGHGGAVFAAFSIGLAAAYGLLHASRPGIDMITTVGDIAAELHIAAQRVQVFDLYVAGLSVLLVLIALSLLTERAVEARWVNRRWSVAVAVPVMIGVLMWNNSLNFDPIRADMIYRHGQGFEQQGKLDFAIAVYQAALNVTPAEDVYWRGLAAAQLSAAHDDAARESYARAQQLNPLSAEYAIGLARTYESGTDIQQLTLAAKFYAEAVQLRPADSALQAARLKAQALAAQTAP